MAKNPVQFQKGYSLPKFLKTYGSEEQCREKLYKYRWPNCQGRPENVLLQAA